ncbi:MAG: methylenetetrahydrofolate reductase C-terminal domain-containing protein [Oscillospiraceae bacterium]|jgi:electron transport complex protein RnfC|nr:methylenetetrahydrofolate reductase C-terminal domain-containing protein [Oscillospiraceae bacterium]
MLITQLKPKGDILQLANGLAFVIMCEGCKEVFFPENDATDICKEIRVVGSVLTDYVCNSDNLLFQLRKHMDKLKVADTLLVFSCGVGVQTVSEHFADKKVFAACDTYPLPGDQGVTPLEYDCDQCGECHLNSTGGICPITACSKSLINGQCGGAKNGKCEVDKDMECGWERIYRRLEKMDMLDALHYPTKIRNFAPSGVE